MPNPFKIITCTIDQTFDFAAFILATKILCSPWNWQNRNKIKMLEENIASYFGFKYAFGFSRGRDAFYYLLKALDIGPNDEVLAQAFTCEALIAPILWRGARPVYADIGKDFNMNLETIKKSITPKTKALVVQHTFGIPADIHEIARYCKEKNIYLVEDLAHSLGGRPEGKALERNLSIQERPQFLGQYSIASFGSFGQDKKISALGGGILFTNNLRIARSVKNSIKILSFEPVIKSIKKLVKMKTFFWAIRTYYFAGLGKFMIFLSRKLKLAGKPVEGIAETHFKRIDEKEERKFLHRISPISAQVVNFQIKRFQTHETKRAKAVEYYNHHLDKSRLLYKPCTTQPLLRYPIRVDPKRRKKLISALKNKRVLAGEWYQTPILRFRSTDSMLKYRKGSCPEVEKATKEVLNLPTHYFITTLDQKRIIQTINDTLA